MAIFFKYFCTLLSITLVIPALANPQGGGGGGGSTQPGGDGGSASSQPAGPKATYYTTSDGLGTPSGSCGYGELGRTENNGEVCTATSRLYNGGAGCGACYQVRCKNKDLCSEEGTKVVVTNSGEGPATDFILSYTAYAKLAKYPAVAAQLFAQGVVDIEYRRVSCKFGANLMIRIQEHSKFPSFLSIVVMNQGGATDILAVEIYEVCLSRLFHSSQWIQHNTNN
nr:expansin-like B1 [Ipomoea trifida]